MSKAVRIREHLHAEVERLAKEEKRSLTNMVEVLLEQALRLDTEVRTKETVQTEPVYMQVQSPTTLRADRREVKPDFK